MPESLEAVLRERCQLDSTQPVLVGVSGGPDSLCLMDVIRRAGYRIVVAHFDHMLRPESAAEARAVEGIAASFGLPYVVESADVGAYARAEGMSIEEAARVLRYRFLFAQAGKWNAQAVAVGHTADDQVETVLMHFIRGAGLTGLKGMPYRTFLPAFDRAIPVVRPLLDTWREETVAYCASHELQPHYDPSNDSSEFFRNRLRRELIPMLETYNPRFREAVWRSVQSLAADHALVNGTLDDCWKECVIVEQEGYVAFDLPRLALYSSALQRNLLRRAAGRLLPGQEMVYSVFERALAFVADEDRLQTDLAGGLLLLREGDLLYMARSEAELPLDRWPQMPADRDLIPLSMRGAVDLCAGWRFSWEKWQLPAAAWEQSSRNEDRFQVWLDAAGLPGKLQLRVRRPGDVFEPLGLDGHSQKLSDFFTNAKLPKRARDRWPLLCAEEKIIWVPGYRPAETFKLRPDSQSVIYFSLRSPALKARDGQETVT
jgi:tRNA(Ile)-lysidine synthase